MKRPEQHRIGEWGELHVAATLVQHGWIVEKLQSDYGFDFLIQRTVNDHVTGDFALVQVKASRSQTNRGVLPSFRITQGHLILWESVPIPAFLIVASTESKECFLLNCKVVAKSVAAKCIKIGLKDGHSIRVAKSDALDEERFSQLDADIAAYWKEFRGVAAKGLLAIGVSRLMPGIGTVALEVAMLLGVVRSEFSRIINLNTELRRVLSTEEANRVTVEVIKSFLDKPLKLEGMRSTSPNPAPAADG